MTDPAAAVGDPTIDRLRFALGNATRRGPPPVERWNPPYCGAIDMRIAADGTWHHDGAPIRRPALVKLFASILRREPDGSFVLVTPVESVGITVEDAPFVAVEMAIEGDGPDRRIAFRTNVDDLVPVGADHGLRFAPDAAGGLRPYVHVRRDLWALLTRALTYDLLALAEDREGWLGVEAGGLFHRIAPAESA
ncbi:DUF1285 domain-containing protein [Methylobacterium sp. Leaf117]|uniref:DUF1285 domain-containing protein n=1 Tax=Methylobacterium sp. Leaf117 TaxID=1736260 RepID=UPI0006FEEB6A|nr:DUF1285 domain-containing protein [Methylobacterium sp. Leaf117]KQP88576.1 hypothetical protein ASF57_09970 [Methylobacterium sp. Leaf117]